MKVMSMVKILACIFACVVLLASCGVTVTPGGDGGVNITPTPGGDTQTPHVHAFVKDDLGSDFDCNVGATVVSRCSCGETKTEVIKPTAHQLTQHEGKAPTCLLSGYEEYVECAVCSYTTFKNIPAPGHQYTDYAAKAPTCTEPGWTAYKACSACDSTTRVDLPKTDHTYVNGFCACGAKDPSFHEHRWDNGVTVAATCTKNGSITYTCLDTACGETKQEAILAQGHAYQTIDAKAPTCTEDGCFSYLICTNANCDGIGIQAPIVNPALGHDDKNYEAKAATCTEFGWNAYSVCQRCDRSTYAEIPTLGHDDKNYEAKAATCTEFGWNAYVVCERCGRSTYAEIPAFGHDDKNYEAKAATCTEFGWNAYVVCERCDRSTYAEIPALGHKFVNGYCACGQDDGGHICVWDNGYESAAPTCTTKGVKTFTCTDAHCDETKTESIPALGHDDVNYDAKAATCTEFGWNAYSVCGRCERSTYEEIPTLGHADVEYEGKAATCTEFGWNAYSICERCSRSTYAEIPALGHDNVHYEKKDPTCEEDGWHAYDVCKRCDYSTFILIPAKGHSFTSSSITTQPTCTMSGIRTYRCTCGESYEIDIDPLGHDWGDWFVSKDATCTASGLEQRICLNESKHVETQGISPIGHNWGEWHVFKKPTCVNVGEEISHCLNDSSHEKKQTIPMVDHTLNADGFCTECEKQIKPPLAMPTITTNGFSIFWNTVSGAAKYELILQYNGTRENLKLTATSCDLTEKFLECTAMTIQIRAIAVENSDYSNSPYLTFEFVIPTGTIVNHGGIGQSVNLLQGSYTDYENGSQTSIFNPNVLNRVNVDDYSGQKAEHYSDATYSESLEAYVESLNESINDKMSVNASVGYGGMAKVTAGYSFEVGSSYEKKNYSETQAIFYDIYYHYKGYQTGMKSHLATIMAMNDEEREVALAALTSVMFRNDAMKLQNGEMTPEAFIARYGTHIITEAIYGAEFNAHYERLSTKAEATETFGEDIKSAITASIAASIYGIDLGLDVNSTTTVSSSTFVSSTTNAVHSKFIFDAVGGTKPVNMAAMSFAEFSAVCEAWANSIENEADYALIDVPNGSLWFVWDFLGDDYAEAKAILNNYFYTTCDAQSDAINAKIAGMYKDFFTFDKDTGVLTIDFSGCQAPGESDVDLNGANYTDGVSNVFNGRQITIYPAFNGNKITKVVFKGGYMTNYSNYTNQLITNKFINLNIKFDENWSDDIIVEFQNFGYTAPDGSAALDFSETKSENITIIVTGAAYIQGGAGGSYLAGLQGIQATGKNLTIEGTGTFEVKGGAGANGTSGSPYGGDGRPGRDGGVGVVAKHLAVNIVGKLRVYGGNGGDGGDGAYGRSASSYTENGTNGGWGGNGGNGASAILVETTENITASNTYLYGGDGGDGGYGGDGGNGATHEGKGPTNTHLTPGNGGHGGRGGDGGNGGNTGLLYILDNDSKGGIGGYYGYGGDAGSAGCFWWDPMIGANQYFYGYKGSYGGQGSLGRNGSAGDSVN